MDSIGLKLVNTFNLSFQTLHSHRVNSCIQQQKNKEASVKIKDKYKRQEYKNNVINCSQLQFYFKPIFGSRYIATHINNVCR